MPVVTSAPSTFVGRESEVTELLRLFSLAELGDTHLVLIAGEAGVGKSRLIGEFSRRIAQLGGMTILGGCPFSPEVEIPYAPFVEMLRNLNRGMPQADLLDAIGPHREELARLLPDLAIEQTEGRSAASLETGSSATQIFEALVALLERLGQGTVVVLVIEDLQWADRSTLALLAFMARILHEARVLIVTTYRGDSIDRSRPLARMLVELDRAPTVSRIDLERFDHDTVAALMTAALGSPPDARFLSEVVARSDGNAFFAEELTKAGFGRPDAGLPCSLRELLLTQIADLPREVQTMLRLAAAVGRRVDHGLIAAAGTVNEETLSAALREAITRGLLVPVRDALGVGFMFRHALIRESLEEDLLPEESTHIHRSIALAMSERDSLDGNPLFGPAELAHHWLLAKDDRMALPALLRAARSAEDRYAFPEAASQYRLALEIWDRMERGATSPDDIESLTRPGWDRQAVLRQAAETTYLSGGPREAVELIDAAIGLTDRTEDPMVIALAFEAKARFLADDDDPQLAVIAARKGVDLARALEPSASQARLRVTHARTLLRAGATLDALAESKRAIEVAQQVAAPEYEGAARSILGVVLGRLGQPNEAITELRRAREIVLSGLDAVGKGPASSRIMDVVGSYTDRAEGLDRAGQSTQAGLAIVEGANLARRLGVDATVGGALGVEVAARLFRRGEWDAAERLTKDLLTRGVRGRAEVQANVLRARLATGRGRFADAEAHLGLAGAESSLLGELGTLRGYRAAVADLAIWRGHLSTARSAVATGLAVGTGSADRTLAELVLLGIRAEADAAEGARLRRAPRDLEEALTIANELLTLSRGLLERTPSPTGQLAEKVYVPFSGPIAAFARSAGAEAARAEGHLDATGWAALVSEWSALGEPYRAAYAGWRTAEALLIHKGSRSEITNAAQSAWQTAVDLGASPLQREIEMLAARARVQLTISEPEAAIPLHSSSAGATLGLSPRETEVLLLVSQGLTNRQVGEALFITEKTAAHHVSNILSKLGAPSRVVASAMAHRAGLNS